MVYDYTLEREHHRACQNSGLFVEGEVGFNYYGYLTKIWELRYANGGRVVLFQCEWYNTDHKSRIYADVHVTSIDITRLWYKDDPFVLPSNVRQVFYVNDTSNGKNWRVVELVRHRCVWNIPEDDELPPDPLQQDETEDCGIVVNTEEFDVQHNRDNVNPADELMPSQVNDQNVEDGTMAEYIDEKGADVDYDADVDVDADVDYEISSEDDKSCN